MLIIIAVSALGYSLISFLTVDAGWTTIETDSSKADCSDALIFQYCLGKGELSATAEHKAVSALYTETAVKAYQLFHVSQGFDGVKNLYYINQHPNEELVVDEVLYQAFLTIEKYENRAVYLAPVYAQYSNLFSCNDDAETSSFDPCQNTETAAYFAEIISFARDKNAIDIKLLGDNRIELFVSDAYLNYAAENGLSEFIDFYWMANAFIVDYIADTMKANGFVRGSISSYDGFVRNLDDVSGSMYAFNLFNRDGKSVHQAGTMQYNTAMSIIFLRDYPINNLDGQHYYEFRNGEIRTAYIDVTDGYCKNAVSNMVSYSHDSSCADILLQVMPIYLGDSFDDEKLTVLAQVEIFSIYCEKNTILYNEPSLTIIELYDKDGKKYVAECIRE